MAEAVATVFKNATDKAASDKALAQQKATNDLANQLGVDEAVYGRGQTDYNNRVGNNNTQFGNLREAARYDLGSANRNPIINQNMDRWGLPHMQNSNETALAERFDPRSVAGSTYSGNPENILRDAPKPEYTRGTLAQLAGMGVFGLGGFLANRQYEKNKKKKSSTANTTTGSSSSPGMGG